jgi:hypothetical protein
MASRWHRIGLYFGVAEEAADDRRLRATRPTPSVPRLVLGTLVAAIVGGALAGILDGDVRSGVIFGALEVIVLNGLALWRRRDHRER